MAIICSFNEIKPISDIQIALKDNNYTSTFYTQLTSENVPLVQVQDAKTIHLVCFGEAIGPEEYVARLAELGKIPCAHGPNYFLGLMAALPESEMPSELQEKFFVAAAPDSPIKDGSGNTCFLCVRRGIAKNSTFRRLDFATGKLGWHPRWAFLAQDPA